MARKKISTTIYITPEQNERLKELNQKTKVPVAEYIRQGFDLILEKHKEELPGQQSFVLYKPALFKTTTPANHFGSRASCFGTSGRLRPGSQPSALPPPAPPRTVSARGSA